MADSITLVKKDDAQALFRNVLGKLYDIIELQIRGTTLSYKQFTDSADILIDQTLNEVPMETVARPSTESTGCQFPAPHDIFPPMPQPIRCSANTLSGVRCRGESFPPFTLCVAHWRYYRSHRFLPPGGAAHPGVIHPGDLWDTSNPYSKAARASETAIIPAAPNAP